jgi:hypothetical protein
MGKQEFERSYWSTSTLTEQGSYLRGSTNDSVRETTTTTNEKAINSVGRSGKKARLDFNNILEIRVGDEGCFLVPVNRITERSKVLRGHYLRQATLDGDEIPIIYLPKEDRFLFDIYLQVVYQNEVILPLSVDEAQDPHWSVRAMIRTYMLAERLEDTTSCNIIIDDLIEFYSYHELALNGEDWKLIFDGDYKGSILRKLAVDFCVIATQPDFLKTQLNQMPLEMAIDCVGKFADLRREMLMQVDRDETPYTITTLMNLDLCERYHQHNESCPPCSMSTRESKREASISRRDSFASSEECSDLDSYYSAQQQQWD